MIQLPVRSINPHFVPSVWLTIVPGFRHVRHDPFDATSRFENRPLFDFELHTKRGRWQPSLRTRFEGRFIENQSGFLRIRVRPGVRYSLSTRWNRPPALIVTNEFFFDFRADRYNRNKFQVGISLPATAQFSLMPYYMLLSNRPLASWHHDSIWGLSLFWSFQKASPP